MLEAAEGEITRAILAAIQSYFDKRQRVILCIEWFISAII